MGEEESKWECGGGEVDVADLNQCVFREAVGPIRES